MTFLFAGMTALKALVALENAPPLQVRVAKSALALLQKLASLDGEGNSAPIGNLKAHLVP